MRLLYFKTIIFILLGALRLTYGQDAPRSLAFSSQVADVRFSSQGTATTNSLSLKGIYQDGRFLLDLVPADTEDNIEESVGWDGSRLYILKRFPDIPEPNHPRDKSLAYVEPSLFSRYATHALAAVLLAFCDTNDLHRLQSGAEQVLLGRHREFPEEDNRYKVSHGDGGEVRIEATTPGAAVGPDKLELIPEFKNGFVRWTHSSKLGTALRSLQTGQFFVKYERFQPLNGKLLRIRQVTATIDVVAAAHAGTDFRPKIKENNLRVWDYTGRPILEPLRRGMVDQNYAFIITNNTWSVDTNKITALMLERKKWLDENGGNIPPELRDVPRRTQRNYFAIILAFLIFAVPAAILFGRKRSPQK